jgi:thiol-disulfide isomerase/thioredoxin
MKKWIPIVLVCLVALGAVIWRFGSFGGVSPDGLGGNTCEGRERCVSIYMAPWCPHCKTALPTVQNLLKLSQQGGKNGVRVVVGMGRNPGDSEAMAKNIASHGVLIDDTTEIAEKLNVRGVPAFQVLDKEGKLLLDGQEARQWISENF